MMTSDPAWALAQYVCRTRYADLPASAVKSARRDILDMKHTAFRQSTPAE